MASHPVYEQPLTLCLLSIVSPVHAVGREEGQQTSLYALVSVISPLGVKSPMQIKHGWLAF